MLTPVQYSHCLYEGLGRSVRRMFHLLRLGRLREQLINLIASWEIATVSRNYTQQINRLRSKLSTGGKLKVVFLISDASKWKMQPVYDYFDQQSRYDVLVAVNLWGWHESLCRAEREAQRTFEFFTSRKMKVVYAWNFERHRPIPLDKFGADIVFYGQPWDIHKEHSPLVVSRIGLTCYVPYMVPNYTIVRADCCMPFHRHLFRMFIQNEEWVELCRKVSGSFSMAGEFVAVGHPMFNEIDKALKNNKQAANAVIYAPHWSFPHKDNPNSLHFSTFLWSGKAILEYATCHRDINWIFKPHPVLRPMLLKSGVMTEAEIESYYSSWRKIGECCFDGSYPQLFARSRVMITDCGSFLIEYAGTLRPIIHLISPSNKITACESSARLFSTYYQVHDISELTPILDKIVLRGDDPRCEERTAMATRLNLSNTNAAENIFRHLEIVLQ